MFYMKCIMIFYQTYNLTIATAIQPKMDSGDGSFPYKRWRVLATMRDH
jgi:hypothetical protein